MRDFDDPFGRYEDFDTGFDDGAVGMTTLMTLLDDYDQCECFCDDGDGV